MYHCLSSHILGFCVFGTLSYFSIYLRSTLKDTKLFCICISTYSHVNQLCDQKELVKMFKRGWERRRVTNNFIIGSKKLLHLSLFLFSWDVETNDSYQVEFVCPLLDMTHTFPMFFFLRFQRQCNKIYCFMQLFEHKITE